MLGASLEDNFYIPPAAGRGPSSNYIRSSFGPVGRSIVPAMPPSLSAPVAWLMVSGLGGHCKWSRLLASSWSISWHKDSQFQVAVGRGFVSYRCRTFASRFVS